eukprot:4264237-Amphidinium_carterae.1
MQSLSQQPKAIISNASPQLPTNLKPPGLRSASDARMTCDGSKYHLYQGANGSSTCPNRSACDAINAGASFSTVECAGAVALAVCRGLMVFSEVAISY